MGRVFSALAVLLPACSAVAFVMPTVTPESLARDPDRAGGIYATYRPSPGERAAPPPGYAPFYVSHVGRHGSRYHTSPYRYVVCQKVLNEAGARGGLTARGERIRGVIDRAARHAAGREAGLSEQGVAEQRGIAERLFADMEPLFRGDRRVESASSEFPRCILTMTSFDRRLAELNPALSIGERADALVRPYTNSRVGHGSFKPEAQAVTMARVNAEVEAMTPAVLARLFAPGRVPAELSDPVRRGVFVRSLFDLSLMMQDTEGDERIDDLFSAQERFAMWAALNAYRYAQYGATCRWGDANFGDAMAVIRSVVDDFDSALARPGERVAAFRFGHDYSVIGLLAALQAEGLSARTDDLDALNGVWVDFAISPMSANVQFRFYRAAAGEVLVGVLHNERLVTLPVAKAAEGPYYRWPDLRAFMLARLAAIRALPAVRKLNFDAPLEVDAPGFGTLPVFGEER